jgi:hypothetical protein
MERVKNINMFKNNLKLYTYIGIVFVLTVGTLSHFIYGWSGENYILGLFVPVNESTWEHMKLVFFPMIIYGTFMYFRLSSDYPHILQAICTGILTGTWLIAIMFYSYSGILGFNVLVLDIVVFIASVLVAFRISYKITLTTNSKHTIFIYRIVPITLVIIMAILFITCTYNPFSIGLFSEPLE